MTVAFAASTAAAVAEPIRGAGSTFAGPVVAAWSKLYEAARADGGEFVSPDWTVDYELVGSLGGVMRLDQPEIDFAATDNPLSPNELVTRGRQQFPFVLGSIAVVTNLDGLSSGQLRLSGGVLADIYAGRIQNWSDPAIRALNPGLALPDLRISVQHRRDGSGSTFVFTEFLSASSAEWKARYGADTLIAWPLGTSAEGTGALVRAVRGQKGAIGYVEYGQAVRAGLAFALVQNRAGRFVAPDPAGVQAAAAAIDWQAPHFSASLTDQTGEAAYPIATATFAVLPVASRGNGRMARVRDFFRTGFESGAGEARGLGYVPLPDALVRRILDSWNNNGRPRS